MLGLTFGIFMVIIFSILANVSLQKKEAGEFIVDVILLFFFIYTSLMTMKSVF